MEKLLFIIVLLSLFTVSCRKDHSIKSSNNLSLMSGNPDNEHISGPNNTTTGVEFVELGRKYGSVFNVNNVKAAWNQLSTNQLSSLAPTHRYIKFMPKNPTELNNLVNAHIPIYTFPLDYEIVKAGDYMWELSLELNGILAFYTYLPIRLTVPECTYDVLDEVYLLDLRSVVAEKAFDLAGESEVYPDERDSGDIIPEGLLTTNNEISQHISQSSDWSPYIREFDIGNLILPAPVGNPAKDINTPPSTVGNSCSCSGGIIHPDIPSGCIRVEETQWWDGQVRYEGVNDVVTDFLGPFGQHVVAVTNPNGCFNTWFPIIHRIHHAFGTIRLPVLMGVIYLSSKKTIKGLNHPAFAMIEYAGPMRHNVGWIQSSGLSNEVVTYLRDANKDNNSTKYYTVATVNNAIYDYDGYASQDGILSTSDNLKVLVHKYSGSAATPMFHKLLLNGSLSTAVMAAFISGVTIAAGGLPVVGSLGSIGPTLAAFPPDIVYGYDRDNNMNLFATDQLKEIAYHEFAHASHYRKTNNNLWEQNISYIANYGLTTPYGLATDPGSTRTDLIEMWAYFLGREYAHRRYGANRHSNGTNSGTLNDFITSWYGENERAIMDFVHIPSGFLHDIRDDNTFNAIHNLGEANNINDLIRGYSISQIFSYLGSGTTTAQELINQLRDNRPVGNSLADFNTLRGNYGY